ncbi:hypothetical protein C8F04DRAFT_106642 [Mycena alexandri]|uniref:Secreted protein n=1 Tax=Mycena alexandri TaxID=1745969 RepID=A0AAD6SEW6_9AGAR|nr:hypothetical protein C8F04DRAFT_106642 [Mycena alexandri]
MLRLRRILPVPSSTAILLFHLHFLGSVLSVPQIVNYSGCSQISQDLHLVVRRPDSYSASDVRCRQYGSGNSDGGRRTLNQIYRLINGGSG